MIYHPITDTIKLIPQQLALLASDGFKDIYPSLNQYLNAIESRNIPARKDLTLLLGYLTHVVSSSIGTQNRFRNEAERFILFCWNEKHKSLLDVNVDDVRDYIDWIWAPPRPLIAYTTIASRFKNNGKTGIRLVNKGWRPFVMRPSKAQRKTYDLITSGKILDTELESTEELSTIRPEKPTFVQHYSLSQTSLHNSYASLNIFLKELVESEHMVRNPVALVKKSCKYLIKGKIYKPPHTLDDDIWQLFIETLTKAADDNPVYEKHRFLVFALKVLFLRISELSHRDYCTPVFGHFRQDSSGEGWVLDVIGKGKKQRLVTVPDGFIENVLIRYRTSLGLPELPFVDEVLPIMPSQKTGEPLHQDSLNNIVEEAFDLVIQQLVKNGKIQQAQSITGASSHWLRHTGATQALGEISETMLAEELGHASVKTTVEFYVAPAHRDRIKSGVTRKL